MNKKQSPLRVTIRYFDEDWTEIETMTKRNLPFEEGCQEMERCKASLEGESAFLMLCEDVGRPAVYVLGEVTLGEV